MNFFEFVKNPNISASSSGHKCLNDGCLIFLMLCNMGLTQCLYFVIDLGGPLSFRSIVEIKITSMAFHETLLALTLL